jgi:signal transduction histidine kinase
MGLQFRGLTDAQWAVATVNKKIETAFFQPLYFPMANRPYLDRCLVAIAVTMAVAVLRWWVDPLLGSLAAYRLFYIAVVFTAWYAGLGPAFLSLALGFFLAAYLFDDTRGLFVVFSYSDSVNCVMYLVVGTCLIVLTSGLTRAGARRRQIEGVLRSKEEDLQLHQVELAHMSRVSVMGEMAASLAHELNQPLHAARNYARGSIRRLAKNPEDDGQVMTALEHIASEVDRAAEILVRIRNFVKKIDAQMVTVPVNDVVKDAVEILAIEIKRTRGAIVCELASDLAPVTIDPIQIEQVVVNLARNGLEAMRELADGQGTLTIGTRRHDEESVEVYVRDGGKGICEQEMDRVFEPFFTTKADGMGMGLAISRSIIRAHDGLLWVSANEDRGCTFHVTLPVAQRADAIGDGDNGSPPGQPLRSQDQLPGPAELADRARSNRQSLRELA